MYVVHMCVCVCMLCMCVCMCVCVSSSGMQLKAATDEVIMGQMRDWNEELQAARELPTDTPQLKMFRDRKIYMVSFNTQHNVYSIHVSVWGDSTSLSIYSMSIRCM